MKNTIKHLESLLCPPGNGVFTVSTAKDLKEDLHQQLFGVTDPNDVEKKWKEDLEKVANANVALFGICSDCGGGIQRGANWGPMYLRKYFYDLYPSDQLSHFVDLGDIRVIPHLLHDKYLNQETIKSCRRALYNDEDSQFPVSPLSMSEYFLDEVYKEKPDLKVITLGGDHSVSYPVVRSYLRHKKSLGKKVAIIHFDAHTDLLRERLGIDLCFGSWCTHILDDLPSPDHLIQLGIRASGKDRGHWEQAFGVQQFWNYEFKSIGPVKLAEKVSAFLLEKKVDEVYISFDIDALDKSEAGATGTPEGEGLSTDDCILFFQSLTKEIPVTGADLVEVAPHVSFEGQNHLNPEPHTTLINGQSIMNFFMESMWRS